MDISVNSQISSSKESVSSIDSNFFSKILTKQTESGQTSRKESTCTKESPYRKIEPIIFVEGRSFETLKCSKDKNVIETTQKGNELEVEPKKKTLKHSFSAKLLGIDLKTRLASVRMIKIPEKMPVLRVRSFFNEHGLGK